MIDFLTKLPPTPPEDCDDAYFEQKANAMFSKIQKELLSADLSSRNVKTRTQAGREISYIEGWHAYSEANRIFGFDGWSVETLELNLDCEGERQNDRGKLHTCSYKARVRVTVYAGNRTLIREGTGWGHGMDRDAGSARDKAAKEAETDGAKRAFRTFGNQFGLALYDKEQRGVSNEEDNSASRASAPTISNVTTLADRERTSKRIADQLIKGPLPDGLLPLDSLKTALGTAGGSRTRKSLNDWSKFAKSKRQQLTDADHARVVAVYLPLNRDIKDSFKPVTEAAE